MKVAMILAAGRGERLRPLTETTPKALCQVKGKPLIEHHVINLAEAGFERLVINHAYLGGQIRHYLGNGKHYGVTIDYSPEPPGGLETGGGIVNALDLLGKNPFLTVNADVYTDFDFSTLNLDAVEHIHLLLTTKNVALGHHGDFGLRPDGMLSNATQEYTFAGIACYHPNVFVDCPQGRYSVTPLIRQYVRAEKVTGQLHHGTWSDIGSMERLNAVL